MASNASITLNDYDGQAGVMGFNIPEILAGNFAAITTQLEVVEDAVEAITEGLVIQNQLSSIRRKQPSTARAASPTAQRGNKWLVSYTDIEQYLDAPTNSVPNPGYFKAFNFEIPTASLSLREDQRNEVYVYDPVAPYSADAAITTFVDEIQDLAVSPYGGEMRVLKIEAQTVTGG